MIATTANINIGLVDILTRSAKQIGVTKQMVVHNLFCKVLKEARLSKPILFKRVSYQKIDPDKQWKNEPITLRPDVYEKCHDMRRVLKVSVSLLLAYAISTYLDQVLLELTARSTEQKETTDNSLPQYSMQSIFTSVAEGFIIRWDKTPKKIE